MEELNKKENELLSLKDILKIEYSLLISEYNTLVHEFKTCLPYIEIKEHEYKKILTELPQYINANYNNIKFILKVSKIIEYKFDNKLLLNDEHIDTIYMIKNEINKKIYLFEHLHDIHNQVISTMKKYSKCLKDIDKIRFDKVSFLYDRVFEKLINEKIEFNFNPSDNSRLFRVYNFNCTIHTLTILKMEDKSLICKVNGWKKFRMPFTVRKSKVEKRHFYKTLEIVRNSNNEKFPDIIQRFMNIEKLIYT